MARLIRKRRRFIRAFFTHKFGAATPPTQLPRPHTFWRETLAGSKRIRTHSQLGTPVGITPAAIPGASLLRKIIRSIHQVRGKRPLPKTKVFLGRVIGRHTTVKPPVRRIVLLLQRRVKRAQPRNRAFFVGRFGGFQPHNEFRYPLVKREQKRHFPTPVLWIFPRRFVPPAVVPPPVGKNPRPILVRLAYSRRQPKKTRPRFLQISGSNTHQIPTARPMPYATMVKLVRRRRQPLIKSFLSRVIRTFAPVTRKHAPLVPTKLAPKRRFLRGAVQFIRTIGRRVVFKPPLYPIRVLLVRRRNQPLTHSRVYPLIRKYTITPPPLLRSQIKIRRAPQRKFQRGRIRVISPKILHKTKNPPLYPIRLVRLITRKRRLPATHGRVAMVVRTFGVVIGGSTGVWRPTFRPHRK